MEAIEWLKIIGIITAFISLLLAFFLFTITSKNKLSNQLFACFLILSAIDLSGWFQNLFLPRLSNFGMFKNLLSYLQMPVFYLYILSVCYTNFKLKFKHLLHLIPLIIINVIMIPRFYSVSLESKLKLWENYTSIWEVIFIHITIEIIFISYLITIFSTLKRYKTVYQQNFSDNEFKTYQWLFQFASVSAIAHSIVLLKNIFKYVNRDFSFEYLQLLVSFIALFITCWFVIKALKYPELFKGIDASIKPSVKKNTFSKKENNPVINQLKSFMRSDEPFLNPTLSISNLAQQLNLTTRELSELINQNLNQHFFDFINEYRINKAKDILKDVSKSKLTILEILYEVGFNSKSSFNTAFKKHTGLTPSQFRKTH